MALINCPECGKEISDKATACPNCGFPVKNASTNIPKPTTSHYNFIKMRTGFGITDLSLGIMLLIMVLQSEGGVANNSRIMGTSWFFIITGILCIIGKQNKGFTIASIVFYSLGIIYNLAMSFKVIAHFLFVIIMIVFLTLTAVSLSYRNSFNSKTKH